MELLNLIQQFLFRKLITGQPKSNAAASNVKIMNNQFIVGPKTENVFNAENVFNDSFWTGLDGVYNALDNMEARIYVDNQFIEILKS